jgi:hypothetical protein
MKDNTLQLLVFKIKKTLPNEFHFYVDNIINRDNFPLFILTEIDYTYTWR